MVLNVLFFCSNVTADHLSAEDDKVLSKGLNQHSVSSKLRPGLTMTHLSLGIRAHHPVGLCQRQPFLFLVMVTLAVQEWDEHDKV